MQIVLELSYSCLVSLCHNITSELADYPALLQLSLLYHVFDWISACKILTYDILEKLVVA